MGVLIPLWIGVAEVLHTIIIYSSLTRKVETPKQSKTKTIGTKVKQTSRIPHWSHTRMKWSPGRMHRSLASHIILRGCRYVIIPICYRVPINCTYKEELEYIQHASTNVCVEESFACHNLCLVFQTHCLLFDFYYTTSISLVRPQTNSHISTYQKIVTPCSSSTQMSSSRSSCSCTIQVINDERFLLDTNLSN